MKLILFDRNREMCEAWRNEFVSYIGTENGNLVSISLGDFQQLEPADCIVSPANSFGIMDGGLDLVLKNYFGSHHIQEEVQTKIRELYLGEQPVGTSLIIETDDPRYPWLAHTPTMRIPKRIDGTENVYNAMRAVLIAVEQHNKYSDKFAIETIAIPGLGAATGNVPKQKVARQMLLAWHFYLKQLPFGWANASAIDGHVRSAC